MAALTPADHGTPRLPPGGSEEIDPATAAAEAVILGLRTDRGVPLAAASEAPLVGCVRMGAGRRAPRRDRGRSGDPDDPRATALERAVQSPGVSPTGSGGRTASAVSTVGRGGASVSGGSRSVTRTVRTRRAEVVAPSPPSPPATPKQHVALARAGVAGGDERDPEVDQVAVGLRQAGQRAGRVVRGVPRDEHVAWLASRPPSYRFVDRTTIPPGSAKANSRAKSGRGSSKCSTTSLATTTGKRRGAGQISVDELGVVAQLHHVGDGDLADLRQRGDVVVVVAPTGPEDSTSRSSRPRMSMAIWAM